MSELTPSKLAMLLLKMNLYLFIITLGVNSLALFPYYMHVNQVSNNIALDVANRNYILMDDVEGYVDHFGKTYGQEGAMTYSLLTFKESEIGGNLFGFNQMSSASTHTKTSGLVAYADPIDVNSNAYVLKNGGRATVAVSVNPLEGSQKSKSMVVGKSSFDPLNSNVDVKQGMDGHSSLGNNSVLVQRGTPFEVSVKTRYKLSGGVLGFMLHAGIPMESKTVGVTTKYYQYGG